MARLCFFISFVGTIPQVNENEDITRDLPIDDKI